MDYEEERIKHPDNLLYQTAKVETFLYAGSLKELNNRGPKKFSSVNYKSGKLYYGAIPFSTNFLPAEYLTQEIVDVSARLIKEAKYSGLVNATISQSIISLNSNEKSLFFIVSGTPVVERSRTRMDDVRDFFHKIIDY